MRINTDPRLHGVHRRRRLVILGFALASIMIGLLAMQRLPNVLTTLTSSASGEGSRWGGLHGEPTADDGKIQDGKELSVFDEDAPAVGKLDGDLLAALQRAASDAGDDGVTFRVNSGWRSAAFQERLLQDAIAEYGSREEAARWVATAETSPHVSGNAVDIGPYGASDWLAKHGSGYDLCQIYANEPWHYELRRGASAEGCPQMYGDPTQDPRMQQ